MLRALVLLSAVAVATGHHIYAQNIPGGAHVRDPCDSAGHHHWIGVGHWAVHGAGPNNPFGADFAAANHTWTTALCQKDSDGDGQTNGQELGDPNCSWTPGTPEHGGVTPGHPGICEPLTAPACASHASMFSCCGQHACPHGR